MENVSPVLLIAVSALFGALLSGGGVVFLFRRELDTMKGKFFLRDEAPCRPCPAAHQVMTMAEHEAVCSMKTEPINVKINHLREGQGRVETKVDSVEDKVDKLGTAFQDLKILIMQNLKEGG